MPIQNKIIENLGFVYTWFTGNITNDELLEYVQNLTRQIAHLPAYREISDLSRPISTRDLTVNFVTNVTKEELNRPNARTGPLAILAAKPSEYGLARAYATFAEDTRTKVLVSYDREECIQFLGYSEEDNQKIRVLMESCG